jgi:hypothetical protein
MVSRKWNRQPLGLRDPWRCATAVAPYRPLQREIPSSNVVLHSGQKNSLEHLPRQIHLASQLSASYSPGMVREDARPPTSLPRGTK